MPNAPHPDHTFLPAAQAGYVLPLSCRLAQRCVYKHHALNCCVLTPITFCWISLVLATKLPGQPHTHAGISCVRPRTLDQYIRWLPRISIALRGELGGPNSMGNAPPGLEIIMVDP